MKLFFIPILFLLLVACGQEPASKTPTAPLPDPQPVQQVTSFVDSIVGERINGPANIRDTVNGEILFSLNDSVLVSCTEAVNGWYAVGVFADIPASDFEKDTLRKGTTIIVEGKPCGKVLKDMYVTTSTNNKQTWAELTGFTHQDNIYPYSIIEKALADFIGNRTDWSLEAFHPFVKSFKLEPGTEEGDFVTYLTHENWIDDPSPMLRIELVFQGNKLLGIIHSRPLTLPGTTDYPLDRGLSVLFFNDVSKQVKDKFIKQFNEFLKRAD